MRLWRFLAPVIAVCLTVASAPGEEIKLAYVDLQRALNESEPGKKAKQRFKKEVDKLQNDLAKQKDELDALKEQLAKKALVMKDEERRSLEKEYQRKLRDFERTYEDSQGELAAKDNELTRDLLKEVQVVIAEFGHKGGYTIILEQSSSSVLYGDPKIDVTDEIIEEYNKHR